MDLEVFFGLPDQSPPKDLRLCGASECETARTVGPCNVMGAILRVNSGTLKTGGTAEILADIASTRPSDTGELPVEAIGRHYLGNIDLAPGSRLSQTTKDMVLREAMVRLGIISSGHCFANANPNLNGMRPESST